LLPLSQEVEEPRKVLNRGKSNERLRQREVQRKSNPVPYSSSVAPPQLSLGTQLLRLHLSLLLPLSALPQP